MQGIEVGIDEILNCREKRVAIQNEMIKKYNKPVISFTMNIPGPIKTNNEIKKAFDIGKNLILKKLKENKKISYLFISHDINVVKKISDRLLIIKDGEIIESGTKEKIFSKPEKEYTKKLIEISGIR